MIVVSIACKMQVRRKRASIIGYGFLECWGVGISWQLLSSGHGKRCVEDGGKPGTHVVSLF